MAWFTGQLFLLLLVTFLVGLGVGYLLWIYGWRRRIDADAGLGQLRQENDRLRADLTTRDDEVVRLQALAASADDATRLRENVAAREEELERLRGRLALVEQEAGDARDEAAGATARARSLAADLESRTAEADGLREQLATRRRRPATPVPATQLGLMSGLDTEDDEPRGEEAGDAEPDAVDAGGDDAGRDDAGDVDAGGDDADAVDADAVDASGDDAGGDDAGGDDADAVDADTVDADGVDAGGDEAGGAEIDLDGDAIRLVDAPPDDLTRVEGIGPKMAGALVAGGIHTFGALAATSEDELRATVERAGLRFAPSIGTWSTQARLLAHGDEDAFEALTDRLVAGRDEG